MARANWDVASGSHDDFERALQHVPAEQHAAIRYTRQLREAFDEICAAAHVYSGWGPPVAYFETSRERYVYVSFGMGGIKPQGEPMASADTAAQVIRVSIATFRDWLKPNRTLAWREKPSIDQSDDGKKWASYWRCVQLDDDAKQLNILWNF